MIKLIANRLSLSVLVIWGSMTLVFFILHLLPGDPAEILVMGIPASSEMIVNLQHQFGLDLPLWHQYATYIGHMLQGNFGKSLVSQEEVFPKLVSQFPQTFYLTAASMGISVIGGTLLGVVSSVYRNRFIDYAVRSFSALSISMPTFWTGILLLLIFSVQLKWFPTTGSGGIQYLVLPALTLGIAGTGFILRMVRNSMLEVVNEPFVLTLRAKGLMEQKIMYKHVLRNALIPSVTMVGMLVGELLAGSVVIETVFARQGIGRIIMDAIMAKDFTVVQGAVLLTAVTYVLVNVIVDISYTFIDPRLRRSD